MAKKSARRKKTYHHGNLREALISTAVEMLSETGETSFTLRQLAKRIGVSHAAAYHHFHDKNALMAAVAIEGFRQLDEVMQSARVAEANTARDRLLAVCESYAEFATRSPAHFRVMFGEDSGGGVLTDEHLSPMRVVVDCLHDCAEAGDLDPEDDLEQIGQEVWALVHGNAQLAMGGFFNEHAPEIDEAVVRCLWRDHRPQPAQAVSN